jgi:hypothetical protein
MHCVSRWLVVAVFAGVGHVSAATVQIDMKARHKAMQLPSMNSCAQCPVCQLAPAFESDTTGSGDHPEHVTSGPWMRPQDESHDIQPNISANVIRPTIALRLLYCRWLN